MLCRDHFQDGLAHPPARNCKSHRRTGGNCLSCFKSPGGLYWFSTLSSPLWDPRNHWLLGSSLPPPPQPALDLPGASRSGGGPIVSSRRCGGFYLVPLSRRCEKGKTSVMASTHHPQRKALNTHVMGQDFPGGASGKEPTCQCRRQKRHGFDPWVGKIPWRRAWQPSPVFLPGESRGQRSLAGYNP